MYVQGVSIRVPATNQAVATGLTGDDSGTEITLQLPNNPRPGLPKGRQYNIVMAGGAVRSMTCIDVDRNGIASFRN